MEIASIQPKSQEAQELLVQITYVTLAYALFAQTLEFLAKSSDFQRIGHDASKRKYEVASETSANSHFAATKVQFGLHILAFGGTMLSQFAPPEFRKPVADLSQNIPAFLNIIPGYYQVEATKDGSKASLELAMLNDASQSKQSTSGMKQEVGAALATLQELRKVNPHAIGG
jgi:hypothetical protein